MKVVFIALHHGEYVTGLVQATAACHEVLLILNRSNFDAEVGDVTALAGLPKLTVMYVEHTRNVLGIVPRALRIVAAIRRFKPDVIHCQEDTKDYLAMALPFLGATPFVLTIHDPRRHSGLDTRRRSWSRHGVYEKQLRARANAAIVHGDSLVAETEEILPRLKGRIFSIPHGPNGRLLGLPTHFDWKPGYCLFFGRIEAYKGLPFFIEAIRQLRKQGVAVTGVIAGRGSELDRLKPELANDPAFIVKDWFLSTAEVRASFLEANIVAMPYLDATQSGVAAHAIGLGRPVVATRVGGLPEVVLDGRTGILVEPRDAVGLAAAIRRLVDEPGLAVSMGRAALELADGDLSWRRIAEKTSAVYATLVCDRPLNTRQEGAT